MTTPNSPVGIPQPTGLFAADLLSRSEEYRTAFELLSSAVKDMELAFARYFLFVHALELLLKSYLASQGVTKRELRGKELGHDLGAILDRCIALKLHEFPLLRPFVQHYREMSRLNDFRYPTDYRLSVPTPGQSLEFYAQLQAVVAPDVDRARVESLLDHQNDIRRFPKGTTFHWLD